MSFSQCSVWKRHWNKIYLKSYHRYIVGTEQKRCSAIFQKNYSLVDHKFSLWKYNQYNRISSTDCWWIHLYGHRLAKCIQCWTSEQLKLVKEMLVQQLNMLRVEWWLQHWYSLAHVHWKNPFQGPHYCSYTITTSQMITRGCTRAARGFMHTQTLREEERLRTVLVVLSGPRPDHSSNRPSKMLSNEKGTNLKPCPQ